MHTLNIPLMVERYAAVVMNCKTFLPSHKSVWDPHRLRTLNDVTLYKDARDTIDHLDSLLERVITADDVDGVDFNTVDPGTVAVLDMKTEPRWKGTKLQVRGVVQHQEGQPTSADLWQELEIEHPGEDAVVKESRFVFETDGETRTYRFPEGPSKESRMTVTSDGMIVSEFGSWKS